MPGRAVVVAVRHDRFLGDECPGLYAFSAAVLRIEGGSATRVVLLDEVALVVEVWIAPCTVKRVIIVSSPSTSSVCTSPAGSHT